jgi:two-component system OmpR family response regulator
MLNEGQVVSKSQIRERVWESSVDGRVNMVEVYVSYLRRKLDALGPSMIRTVRGLGYCLRNAREPGRDARQPVHNARKEGGG